MSNAPTANKLYLTTPTVDWASRRDAANLPTTFEQQVETEIQQMRQQLQAYGQHKAELEAKCDDLRVQLSHSNRDMAKAAEQVKKLEIERDALSTQLQFMSADPEGRDVMFEELRYVAKDLEEFFVQVKRVVQSGRDSVASMRELAECILETEKKLPHSSESNGSETG